MKEALVIGGASHLLKDLERVGGLSSWNGIVVGLNHASYMFSPLDAVATLHPEHINRWRGMRERAGMDPVPFYAHNREGDTDCVVWRPEHIETWTAGSSGLFGAGVARWKLGADCVILAGIGLENGRNIYGTNHSDYQRYRSAWEDALRLGLLDGVACASAGTWLSDLIGAAFA